MTPTGAGAAQEDRLARAGLSLLARPGSRRIARAVELQGAGAALAEITASLLASGVEVAGNGEVLRCLESAAAAGTRFICPGDDEWPVTLDGLSDPEFGRERGMGGAVGLWVRGPLALAETVTESVGVVGSRAPTSYGTHVAGDLASGLADAGWCVISGAAYGIDAAAHRGALAAGGRTVAVLAGGCDVRYPSGNAGLLDRIAAEGLVVSEVCPGMAATRTRFLIRNRLIAALSVGTVLVEAGLRSGARNTVAHARALSRPVAAVPGPVTSALSVGAHHELRMPGTTLVTSAAEVLELVAPIGQQLIRHVSAPLGQRDGLSPHEARVLDAVPVRVAAGVGAIARTAGCPVLETSVILNRLAASRLVTGSPDGWRLAARANAPVAEAPAASRHDV